jgi:predicted nucleic acid-binding protein
VTFLYFDASAIVKGYVLERGSACVDQIFEAAGQVFTCKISFAEVMATLRKKRDELPSHGSQIDQLAEKFSQDWESITAVDLSAEVLNVVRGQAFRHPLKALDLLHLSAAVFLRQTTRIPLVFVCSDQNLLAAARREFLRVFDPELDDPATLV